MMLLTERNALLLSCAGQDGLLLHWRKF
jgi:hypothetical protein